MTQIARIDRIDVDRGLYDFVNREAIPGTGIGAEAFWRGFAALVDRLASRNASVPRAPLRICN
jgi:malate synthase